MKENLIGTLRLSDKEKLAMVICQEDGRAYLKVVKFELAADGCWEIRDWDTFTNINLVELIQS